MNKQTASPKFEIGTKQLEQIIFEAVRGANLPRPLKRDLKYDYKHAALVIASLTEILKSYGIELNITLSKEELLE
jgi:hypothetical protein